MDRLDNIPLYNHHATNKTRMREKNKMVMSPIPFILPSMYPAGLEYIYPLEDPDRTPVHFDEKIKGFHYLIESQTLVDAIQRPTTFKRRYLDSLAAIPVQPDTPVVGKVGGCRHISIPADIKVSVEHTYITGPHKVQILRQMKPNFL